jgi:hypothetical protein
MVIADEVFTRRLSSGPAAPSGAVRGTVAVLEWRAWDGFLLTQVLGGHAIRIETDPFCEFPCAEFERICGSVTTVCFQFNLSVRRRLPIRVHDLANRFTEQGLYVVNGFVQDVRKSTLHSHLEAIGLLSPKADPSGAHDEILFIKTDLNYGGDVERWLPPEIITAAGFENLISPDLGAYHYKLVERGKLPATVWTDPAIVVERYIANAEDSFFRVYFSGKQVIIVKSFAPGIVKKMSNDPRDINFVSELQFLKAGNDQLPISAKLKQDVATFVEYTPVEFGCVDIVHDGHDRHYIIDLNLTPYAGTCSSDAALKHFLCLGITHPDRRKPRDFLASPLASN